MSDLIDRQAAIATAISGRIRTLPTTEDGENWIRVNEVRDSLLSLPTAQPKRGKWIEYSFPAHECIYCSECKEEYAPEALWDLDGNSLPNYCPNCGARMDEV